MRPWYTFDVINFIPIAIQTVLPVEDEPAPPPSRGDRLPGTPLLFEDAPATSAGAQSRGGDDTVEDDAVLEDEVGINFGELR